MIIYFNIFIEFRLKGNIIVVAFLKYIIEKEFLKICGSNKYITLETLQ
jgi:hypothetical protein